MNKRRLHCRIAATALATFAWIHPSMAAVFSGAIENEVLVVRDALTGFVVGQALHPDQFLLPGGVDVNGLNNRVYLSGMVAGQPGLFRNDGVSTEIALPKAVQPEFLGVSVATGQFQVLGRSTFDNQVHLFRFNLGTDGLIEMVSAGANCCAWRGMVSAYDKPTRRHFVVARRDTDVNDQLLAFNYGNAGLTLASSDLSTLTGKVVAIAYRSNDLLYALLFDASSQSLQFGILGRGATASFAPLGAPIPSGDLFVVAGGALIDEASSQMYVVIRESLTASPRVAGLNLATGALTLFAPQNAAFLFVDGAFALDGLFADGFE